MNEPQSKSNRFDAFGFFGFEIYLKRNACLPACQPSFRFVSFRFSRQHGSLHFTFLTHFIYLYIYIYILHALESVF